MKQTAKGIVVILAAVMFVLCFSTQGSANIMAQLSRQKFDVFIMN